jgi:hypothetical protein
MFSKELQLMDRNTAKYMIDELQEQLDTANSTIREKEAALSEKDAIIARLQAELEAQKSKNLLV